MTEMTVSARPAKAIVGIVLVVLTEVAGAVFLRQFLLADDWRAVIALLALSGGALVALQRNPSIEAKIENAFAAHGRFARLLAVAIVLLYPFVLEKNTYAMHLLIVAQLYAVLALALNFQLGSANIPNFATGASYGIGAYVSALLALNWDVSFWLALDRKSVV